MLCPSLQSSGALVSAKGPATPLRWPLCRRLRMVLCRCYDRLHFRFIAMLFYFDLMSLAGDELLFFSAPLLSGAGGCCQPQAPLAAVSQCDAARVVSLPLAPVRSSLNGLRGVYQQHYETLRLLLERNKEGFVGRRNCIGVGWSSAFCASGMSMVGVLA